MSISRILTAAVIFASVAATSVQAGVIIVGPAATEGGTNNAFPFNLGHFGVSAQRYEQLYAASNFGGAPIVISGLQFRPDAGTGAAFSTTLPSITIKLSTIQANSLVPSFGANEGSDLTTVFSGPLSISSAFTGPIGGPKDFDISINFGTMFSYDPSLGNLLLEVQNFGGGLSTQFDSFFGAADTRDYSSDNSATGLTGTTDTLNLVTKFVTAAAIPVPEPMTFSIFAIGIAGAALLRRRPKKKAA